MPAVMLPPAKKKIGRQTVEFHNPPVVAGTATTVGTLEGQGPLAPYFDRILTNDLYGEKTAEKAESRLLLETAQAAVEAAGIALSDIDVLLAGDLINQIVAANFAARELGRPFFGLYGACSTAAEGLLVGSMLIDGGFAQRVLACTSSHYHTAERQYRLPIEMNAQRKPTAQTTVTGSGAVVLANAGSGIRLTHGTIGRVVDLGVKDPSQMGAAMAPAASDTIACHLQDLGRRPGDYDLIVTGDLGSVGRDLALMRLGELGYDCSHNLNDCGVMVYGPEQNTKAGGSGCGCSAVVTYGYIFKQMAAGRWRRVLLVGTGALLNTLTYQQGETIPGIGHAVVFEAEGKEGEGDAVRR